MEDVLSVQWSTIETARMLESLSFGDLNCCSVAQALMLDITHLLSAVQGAYVPASVPVVVAPRLWHEQYANPGHNCLRRR